MNKNQRSSFVLTQKFEDEVKLLLNCGTRKQRSTCRHLIEDTPNTPTERETSYRQTDRKRELVNLMQ